MKGVLLAVIYLLPCASIAQISITAKGDDNSNKVEIASMKTNITIIGNMATTTITYALFNPTNRVMDGSFEFALTDAQSITGFALDINGTLREGVVVDKEKGRVAYENTIARKVDPGLLEITNGNNFRARIYPMPIKGTRTIQIQFEQALPFNQHAWQYYLPAMPNIPIAKNETEIKCDRSTTIKKDTASWLEPDFKNNVQYIVQQNFSFNKPLSFFIDGDEQVNHTEAFSAQKGIYFYYNQPLPNNCKANKRAPKTITLFWDMSLSHNILSVKNEQAIVLQYVQKLKNVTLHLIPFNITQKLATKIDIIEGNTSALEAWFNTQQYNGGTNYECLALPNITTDEILICTDGIQNFGITSTQPALVPLYVINSNPKSNTNEMRNWFSKKGGGIIDAVLDNVENCVTQLYSGFMLMFVQYPEGVTIFPNKPVAISNQIHVSGMLNSITDSVVVCVGTPDNIIYKKTIKMSAASYFNERPERLYAQQQIQEWLLEKEKNKERITQLGTQYKLITPFTSLIVLDNVEDYLRYNITPPAVLMNEYAKLKPAYDSIELERKQQHLFAKETLLANVAQEFSTYMQWWDKNFKITPKVTPKHNVANRPVRNVAVRSTDALSASEPISPPLASPVANAPSPAVDYRYNTSAVDRSQSSSNVAQEVIVIGYGTVKKKEVTGAVSTVQANEMSNASTPSLSMALNGKAPGLQVLQSYGAAGAGSTIRVRGVSSLQDGEPLIVLDGVYTTWDDVQGSINVNNIDHVDVLKDVAAFSLYGSRAANGVIIITSKNPKKVNSSKRKNTVDIDAPTPVVKNWYDVLQDASVTGIDSAYTKLLSANSNNYIFFIRAAEKYKKLGATTKAIEVLSNLVEINMENHELLRACAYMLESWGMYAEAIKIYEQVKNIKGEEPQTYRDLALAMSANKQYTKALDMLEGIPAKHWGDYENKFSGIKSIIINEWNNVLKQHPKTIDSAFKPLQVNIPVDIRICLDWNRDNTDIDLHVIDALQEEVYYSHKESNMGGRISNDFTRGYGPEEFLLKKALPGKYKAFINYYGDAQQGAIVPTVVKTTVFRNYGKSNETKEVHVMVLHKLGSDNTAEKKQYLAEIVIPK